MLPNGMAGAAHLRHRPVRRVRRACSLAGRPAPGAGRPPGPRRQGGRAAPGRRGPPRLLLLEECFRHAKAIGAWGAGVQALEQAGVGPDTPGVVTADRPAEVLAELHELLGAHRVWERFTPALV